MVFWIHQIRQFPDLNAASAGSRDLFGISGPVRALTCTYPASYRYRSTSTTLRDGGRQGHQGHLQGHLQGALHHQGVLLREGVHQGRLPRLLRPGGRKCPRSVSGTSHLSPLFVPKSLEGCKRNIFSFWIQGLS